MGMLRQGAAALQAGARGRMVVRMNNGSKMTWSLCCMGAALLAIAAAPPPASTPKPAGPNAGPISPVPAPAKAAPTSPAANPAAAKDHQTTFISPMGEPFRSDPGGTAPDLLWFRQADRNNDGKLSQIEMRADAYRFFKTLDLNHDGEIDPEELQHYETDVAPEVTVMDVHSAYEGGPDSVLTSDNGPQDSFSDLPQVTIAHHKPRPHQGRGAGNYSYFDLPEPVAAADGDLNRGVSAKEFDAAAVKRFLILDVAHDGTLSYAKLRELKH